MQVDKQVAKLQTKYKKIFSEMKPPRWASVDSIDGGIICPPIPFVGKNYHLLENKILIYASAENLTFYSHNQSNSFIKYRESKDDPIEVDIVWRNRKEYIYGLNYPQRGDDITISSGRNVWLLFCVASIVATYELFEVTDCFYKFMENISIDNFCKYGLNELDATTKINRDYINNPSKIKYSIPYIESDLEILQPNYVIMPKKAYDMQSIKDLFHRKVPNATIIPVYELSSKDKNRHLLPMYSNRYTHYYKKHLPMFLKTWVENFWLKDVTEDELWNYYLHVTQEEI